MLKLNEFSNSFELYKELEKFNLVDKNSYWWPNAGSFEVVVGAILTQNTKWENVEKALNEWRVKNGEWRIEKLVEIDEKELAEIIKPVGFYNQKAKRLKLLAKNILEEFGDFENFKENVTRQWLLAQKGIGFESADSILCYACFRDILVVDAYTKRLVKKFGYEFENYEELREWGERGLRENIDRLEFTLNKTFALFHGMIVEFCKKGCK